jgi:excisionase family DNA binding protein
MGIGNTASEFEQPIGLAEAAKLVGIPKKTLIGLAAKHLFPATKIGKRWVTRKSVIDNWLNDRLKSGREKPASSGEER